MKPEPISESLGLVKGLRDLIQLANGIGIVDSISKQLETPQDGEDHTVEVVGHTAAKNAQALELSRSLQLSVKLPSLRDVGNDDPDRSLIHGS